MTILSTYVLRKDVFRSNEYMLTCVRIIDNDIYVKGNCNVYRVLTGAGAELLAHLK